MTDNTEFLKEVKKLTEKYFLHLLVPGSDVKQVNIYLDYHLRSDKKETKAIHVTGDKIVCG